MTYIQALCRGSKMEVDNIDITKQELKFIKALPDFDLTMFLSDMDDSGWSVARKTLRIILCAIDDSLKNIEDLNERQELADKILSGKLE